MKAKVIIFSLFMSIGCKTAVSIIEPKSGSNISGKVIFKEINGEVSIDANIENLTEGKHAIHIHEFGDCSSIDAKSAGGHWNPTNDRHGRWNIKPFHLGDIGNLDVGKDGKGKISKKTKLWCISCDDKNKNIVGKSIIIHAGPDDFSSQPAGAAGARIGCGVIEVK